MMSECVSPSVDDLAQPHLADLAAQAETVGVHRSFVTVAAWTFVDINISSSILSISMIITEGQTLAVDALLAAAAQLVRVNRVGVAVAAAVQAPALSALLQYNAQSIMITYLHGLELQLHPLPDLGGRNHQHLEDSRHSHNLRNIHCAIKSNMKLCVIWR